MISAPEIFHGRRADGALVPSSATGLLLWPVSQPTCQHSGPDTCKESSSCQCGEGEGAWTLEQPHVTSSQGLDRSSETWRRVSILYCRAVCAAGFPGPRDAPAPAAGSHQGGAVEPGDGVGGVNLHKNLPPGDGGSKPGGNTHLFSSHSSREASAVTSTVHALRRDSRTSTVPSGSTRFPRLCETEGKAYKSKHMCIAKAQRLIWALKTKIHSKKKKKKQTLLRAS